jgi:rhodanese-related sulfurtransferase
MSTYQQIDPSDLATMLASGSVLLVDVRNDDEVARGIIEGAIHIPLALLPLQCDALNKAETIVFYCHSGVRSAHAAAFAINKGYKNVYNLSGGVLSWARAGLPFVTISNRPKS